MKLGITGLPGVGKTTIFEALTGNFSETANKAESRIGTVKVPDERVDVLSDMYKPKKTTYAQVEYFLPGMTGASEKKKDDPAIWRGVRDCDALIHVIRNFGGYGYETPDPAGDFTALDQELVIADLMVAEKRLERLDADRKRGKPVVQEEIDLLHQAKEHLEAETPLRRIPEIAFSPLLRGFAFLSAKPMLMLFNNEDDDDELPEAKGLVDQEKSMVIKGKLEHELCQMSSEEAEEFLNEFNITASAMDRVIQSSYDLQGLISFFTVGEDEVRAWTIRERTDAQDAAGTIHTDLKKGFIRAEVISYSDLMRAGNMAEARKQGTLRLEGKTYIVQNGDIINVRFNV